MVSGQPLLLRRSNQPPTDFIAAMFARFMPESVGRECLTLNAQPGTLNKRK